MSGAAGGVTINKEDLKATIRDYRENVLKPLNIDKSYNITGIRRRPEKNIFGDIDIILSFPGGDKKTLKQEFAQYIEKIDKIPRIPHKKNLKYFIHGSIVTILYPITNKPNQYVQIDNVITNSQDEGKFTYNMLDLPAQEQGLTLGLAKTIFTELNPIEIKQLFKDLNIPENIETPSEGEEYDFNLNTSELSLRIVPIGQNGGKEIWKTTNFNDIKTLLKSLGINIEKDKFEDIIQVVKKFKNRRSIDRLKGMFTKNIRVGDAEVGRDKGIAKQKSIDIVSSLEEKYNSLTISLISPLILEEKTKPPIAIFPGKFKPPHKDHLARIQAASQAVGPLGIVKIFISPLSSPHMEDQETITSNQSLAIFKLYQDKGLLPKNVQFQISPLNSPVKSAYVEFETNIGKPIEDQQPYIAVFGKEEAKRFAGIYKIPNITINDFPEANVGDESATNIRIALKNNQDISKFLPDGVSSEEYKQALNSNPKSTLQEIYAEPSKFNYRRIIKSLTKYMLENNMNINPLPKVKFISDDIENAKNFFGKTAYYDPNQCVITLYTMDRHPKDIMRSFAHEMIHHIQNIENRLDNITTQNTNQEGDLPEIEREAYEKGNMTFRNWTDTLTEWVINTPKYNYTPKLSNKIFSQLHELQVNEITLNPNNAVDICGDLFGGEFKVGNIEYIYSIKNIPSPYKDGKLFYNIQFDEKNNDKPSNEPTGNAEKNYIKILSTMYKIILDFTKEEKPEYIGISSLDKSGYRNIYNNLTKTNKLPGYSRKDAGLNFISKSGEKGKFIVLKKSIIDITEDLLSEGKYDKLTNSISSAIFNHWKQDYENEVDESHYDQTYEMDDLYIEVNADIKFIPGSKQLKVDGGADPKTEYLEIKFEIDPDLLPDFWEEVSMNLKDVVRHEIEHLTHGEGPNLKPSKYIPDDQLIRAIIKADMLPQAAYFKLEKEIDANLQGMYFRAKKEKRPFKDVIDTYLNAQSITLKQKKEILNIWRRRLPALNLPLFENKNMTKKQEYIQEYKKYALTELFEKDLPNIKKISPTEYIVGNGKDIEAKYFFKLASLDPNNWEIHWKFTDNNTNISSESWKQVTATSFKILSDFISTNKPNLIEFSDNTDAKTKIYKSKSFIEKLETLFNNQYVVDDSNEYVVYLKKIEEIAKSSIKKRMETLNESYEQALDYFQNGDINSKSKIERWKSIKKIIERNTLKQLYKLGL